MQFRCRRCGETAQESSALSRHVVDEHGRATFGWDVIRVPETATERPVAWCSNLPVRLRARVGLGPREA